jgi:hypothetical protein
MYAVNMSEPAPAPAPTPFQWLESHYDEIANQQGSWVKVAERMTADGVLDRDGKPPLPDAVRVTWFRVKKLREAQTAGPRDVPLPQQVLSLHPAAQAQDQWGTASLVPPSVPATISDIARLEAHLVKIAELVAKQQVAAGNLGPDVLRAVRICMASEYRNFALAVALAGPLLVLAGAALGYWYRGG